MQQPRRKCQPASLVKTLRWLSVRADADGNPCSPSLPAAPLHRHLATAVRRLGRALRTVLRCCAALSNLHIAGPPVPPPPAQRPFGRASFVLGSSSAAGPEGRGGVGEREHIVTDDAVLPSVSVCPLARRSGFLCIRSSAEEKSAVRRSVARTAYQGRAQLTTASWP